MGSRGLGSSRVEDWLIWPNTTTYICNPSSWPLRKLTQEDYTLEGRQPVLHSEAEAGLHFIVGAYVKKKTGRPKRRRPRIPHRTDTDWNPLSMQVKAHCFRRHVDFSKRFSLSFKKITLVKIPFSQMNIMSCWELDVLFCFNRYHVKYLGSLLVCVENWGRKVCSRPPTS